VSFDWWMSAEWAARDEQPILPTSTNLCITRAAGPQRIEFQLGLLSCAVEDVKHLTA
jgi:hypothetical protein